MVSVHNHSRLFLDRGGDRVWKTLHPPRLYEQTVETNAQCIQTQKTSVNNASARQTGPGVMTKLYIGVSSRRHLRKQAELWKQKRGLQRVLSFPLQTDLQQDIVLHTIDCTFFLKYRQFVPSHLHEKISIFKLYLVRGNSCFHVSFTTVTRSSLRHARSFFSVLFSTRLNASDC